MKVYPKYKSTILKWAETIPAHWDCVRTQYLFDIVSGSTPNSNDETLWNGNINWITPADFNTKDHYVSNGKRTISQKGYESCSTTLIPSGSIIFSKRAPIGKVVIATGELCTNQGCFGCIPVKELSNNYFYYLMSILESQYNLLGSGSTFLEISAKEFSSFRLLLPPMEEQTAIASYLDEVIGKIDALVAEKQTQVEDLRKYRMSLITETVTRGLNPNVPLRPSGIDWIGDIPEHWVISKLKFVSDVQTGSTPSTAIDKYWDNPTKNWFTPGDFAKFHLIESYRKVSSSAFEEGACRVFAKNSVLLVAIGGTLGKVGIVCDECSANQQINAISFNNTINPLYGAYYLLTCKSALNQAANSSTLPILNQEQTKNFAIPVPALSEQQEIAKYLDGKTDKIDELIAELEAQLKDLAEYKKAVITEAVTGKVDVRDWKP